MSTSSAFRGFLMVNRGKHIIMPHPAQIPIGDVRLEGDLDLPPGAAGVVVFAHGSGSSRFSGRNRRVAEGLAERRIGSLLLDLLTGDEEAADARTGHLRFDIGFLAERVAAAVGWVTGHLAGDPLPIGLFGASTGAAAALVAAARAPDGIAAVVSRGGRPDLALDALPAVRAPTLLLVGSLDETVLQLNEQARQAMTATRELTVIPGASHLFEEPGTLDEVTRRAGDWFLRWFDGGAGDPEG